MAQYLVHRVVTPDWSTIPAAQLSDTGWLAPCSVAAWAKLCHDGSNLYVRMEAREENIRATLTGPMDQVCEDSCLEFFFALSQDDTRYFNFEFNPLGNSYIAFGRKRETRLRLHPADMEQFHVVPFYTETGWGLIFQIPLAFLQMLVPAFTFTGTAACNFYKCGEQTLTPHYYSWSPMTTENPDFHRRQDFGTLTFE